MLKTLLLCGALALARGGSLGTEYVNEYGAYYEACYNAPNDSYLLSGFSPTDNTSVLNSFTISWFENPHDIGMDYPTNTDFYSHSAQGKDVYVYNDSYFFCSTDFYVVDDGYDEDLGLYDFNEDTLRFMGAQDYSSFKISRYIQMTIDPNNTHDYYYQYGFNFASTHRFRFSLSQKPIASYLWSSNGLILESSITDPLERDNFNYTYYTSYMAHATQDNMPLWHNYSSSAVVVGVDPRLQGDVTNDMGDIGTTGYIYTLNVTIQDFDDQVVYNDGYNTGYTTGYDDGKNDGIQVGYDNGYTQGYGQGQYDGTNFTTLLFSIADVPLYYLKSLFNIELFGVKVYTAVFGLLTFCVVTWLIRRVI